MDVKMLINKNNKLKDFYIINNFKSYNYGFSHYTTIVYKDYFITSKVNYINRTWECYEYQTSCKKALIDLSIAIYNDIVKDYKHLFNIKRLTKKHKKYIIEMFNINNKKLVTFYNTISDYKKIKKAFKIIQYYV